MCTSLALRKEGGKQKLPSSPCTKLVPVTLVWNNALTDLLFPSVYKCSSATAGVNWVMILHAALHCCRKPGWRIGRAGGGDMQEVKNPCAASSSSFIQLAGQARKDILISRLYWFFLFSIWVAKADIKIRSLQPHVLDLEKYKRCQTKNNASF